jgi:hypothetical protein
MDRKFDVLVSRRRGHDESRHESANDGGDRYLVG